MGGLRCSASGGYGSHAPDQFQSGADVSVAGINRDRNHRPDRNDDGRLNPVGIFAEGDGRMCRLIAEPKQAGLHGKALQNEF